MKVFLMQGDSITDAGRDRAVDPEPYHALIKEIEKL